LTHAHCAGNEKKLLSIFNIISIPRKFAGLSNADSIAGINIASFLAIASLIDVPCS
jgi:hypothetical protein